MILRLVTALACLTLAACTNKQLYEGIQINRLNECITLDIPARDECMAKYELSYEDYERAREALL